MTSKTPAMILQELAVKKVGRGPDYQLITCNQGTCENEFEYLVYVLGITASGRGRSKKEAKQETARNALAMLKEYNMDGIPSNIAPSSSPDDCELPHVVNYIGNLDDKCAMNNLPMPIYSLILDDGPPHQKVFSFKCYLGKSLVTTSTSSTKKGARQMAAKLMLERIQDVVPDLAKEQESEQLKLTATDAEALEVYTELRPTTKVDLNIRVCDYHLSMVRYMAGHGIQFEDLAECFEEPHTREKLATLLHFFELEPQYQTLSDGEDAQVWVMAIDVPGAVPLCAMARADSRQEAEEEALRDMFRNIKARVTCKDYETQMVVRS